MITVVTSLYSNPIVYKLAVYNNYRLLCNIFMADVRPRSLAILTIYTYIYTKHITKLDVGLKSI